MSIQRMIDFETTTNDAAEKISAAVQSAFRVLSEAKPKGVRLAYWRVPSSRRFMALIELADEQINPLMDIEATRTLPALISNYVEGGYPRPETVERVAAYGFDL